MWYSIWIGCLSICLIARVVSGSESLTSLQLLHEVINATVFSSAAQSTSLQNMPYYLPLKSHMTTSSPSTQYTEVMNVCDNVQDLSEDAQRTVCCTPHDVRHLYNVKIQQGKFVYFQDPKSTVKLTTKLPPVSSVKQQNKMDFNMEVSEVKAEALQPSKHCEKYYDGTLHVIGRSTVKNVYHAISDNVLPLMAQIILDAYLFPDMLYKPRMLLIGFEGTGNVNEEEGAPHMRLVRDLMTDGTITVDKASGMCFRRVVWGHGPHIFYVDSLQVLRRQVTKFARLFIEKFLHRYKIQDKITFENRWGSPIEVNPIDQHRRLQKRNPRVEGAKVPQGPGGEKPFKPQHKKMKNNAHGSIGGTHDRGQLKGGQQTHRAPANLNVNMTYKGTGPLVVGSRPLRVVVYTRGNTGRGRTIQNEHLIVQALKDRGAEAFICCDFGSTTLEQQLYYAYHADVIMGLHGAAITHGIFMPPGSISLELKTLYAYEANLFGLVAESRYGVHSQVDIRKYFVPGGQRPIDGLLLDRVFTALDEAIAMQKKLGLQSYDKAEEVVRSRSVMVAQPGSAVSNSDARCAEETLVKVITALPGDFVFGPSCPPPVINHVLGPPQRSQTEVCKSLIFTKIRNYLGVKGDSFHCQICAPYVGQ